MEETPNINAQADSLLGTKLDDRYEILSVIASGGMGVVYRGKHILMDKIVAIKMLNAAFSNEPNAFARFQNEAKMACQLSHPNIVTVHDFGIAGDKMYLVMDYVDGQTLGDVLDDETFLPLDRVVSMGLQICDALQYAHDQGLIHRDLKAENIMISPGKDGKDQIKILDFGLAKFFGEGRQQQLSASGFMMGTAYYMSPEQCRGKKADVRSEVYSLACVLYEALSGVPPFVGENVLETVQKHIDETAVPVSEVRPELKIPREVESIITRGLNKNPDERFQSAAEFRAALEQIDSSSSVDNFSREVTSFPSAPIGSSARATYQPYPESKYAGPLLVFLILGVVAGVVMMVLHPEHLAPPRKPVSDDRAVKPDSDWSRHYKAAVLAFEDEKFEEAEKSLTRAILQARQDRNDVELLQALRRQQDVLYVQRKFKDADALDAEIMRLTASTDFKEPDEAQRSAQDERIAKLATFCHERGQCGTAIKLLEHSVEISKRMHGVNSLKTAERIQELASLHIALDENDKAQPLLEQVMEIKSALAKKKSGK